MKLEDALADWNLLEVYGGVVWLAHFGPMFALWF